MEQRPMGRSGLSLSVIGLGCVTFGREIDEDTSYRILDYALERGINWIDTAEGYGGGNARIYRKSALGIEDEREVTDEVGSSENIIGRWLKSRNCRDQVKICSKVSSGNSPENIKQAFQTSLERLQVDHIDIYELHSPDDSVPIKESLSLLAGLVDSAQVGTVGCSNFSAEQLREALAVSDSNGFPRFEVIQPPYSLAAPEADQDIFPLCKSEQIGVTTYSPLAAGFLTGKYTSDRDAFPEGSRFHVIPAHADIYFTERNFNTIDLLKQKSEALNIPMVRLAMAWVLTNNHITSVIVGARKIEHLENAFQAYKMELDVAQRLEMTGWLKA